MRRGGAGWEGGVGQARRERGQGRIQGGVRWVGNGKKGGNEMGKLSR